MKKNQNNFRFWVPIEKVEKSNNDSATGEMLVHGIASTSDEDMDGEFFDTNGFSLSYFLKNGIINWHHQPKYNPEAVIGEPISAKNTPEGLYIKGKLYPSSELARKVFNQMSIMEKDSDNRKIGWSIEGKVLERNADNPNHIKRAILTGVAITHQPKNFNTYANIIKGVMNEEDEDEDNVDEALSTETGAALKKEDLEGKVHDVKGNKLTKADIYKAILGVNHNLNLEQCKIVYNQIFKIMSEKTTLPLTADEITKAFEVLGVGFQKSHDEPEEDDDDDEEAKKKKQKAAKKKTVEKSITTTAENDEDEEANGGKQTSLDYDGKGKNAAGNKSEKFSDFENRIEKSVSDFQNEMRSNFKALATLVKANLMSTNSLSDNLDDVNETLKALDSAPAQAKSKQKSNFVEKGFNSEGGGEDKLQALQKQGYKVIAKSNRKGILDALDYAAETIEEGYTGEFGKAMLNMEAGAVLAPETMLRLYKECKIVIQ